MKKSPFILIVFSVVVAMAGLPAVASESSDPAPCQIALAEQTPQDYAAWVRRVLGGEVGPSSGQAGIDRGASSESPDSARPGSSGGGRGYDFSTSGESSGRGWDGI